jgi:hypothetical protein
MTGIVIYVEFYDHYSLPADWFDKDDVGSPRIVKASGFLLKETGQHIYLASIYDEDSELASGGAAILKKCIKIIRRFDLNDLNSSS